MRRACNWISSLRIAPAQRQILETARDYDLSGEDWVTLESDAQAIVRALKRAERPDEMEVGVASLEQRQREARARLETLIPRFLYEDPQARHDGNQRRLPAAFRTTE